MNDWLTFIFSTTYRRKAESIRQPQVGNLDSPAKEAPVYNQQVKVNQDRTKIRKSLLFGFQAGISRFPFNHLSLR